MHHAQKSCHAAIAQQLFHIKLYYLFLSIEGISFPFLQAISYCSTTLLWYVSAFEPASVYPMISLCFPSACSLSLRFLLFILSAEAALLFIFYLKVAGTHHPTTRILMLRSLFTLHGTRLLSSKINTEIRFFLVEPVFSFVN